MKQKASPATIAVSVVVALALIGAIYWFTMGGGRPGARVEDRFTKPPDMKGAMQMPYIPPPPSGMNQPVTPPGGGGPVPPGGPPMRGR